MLFPIILTRVLFIACMVFILGYIFGPFSKNKTLAILSRIATILAIVLFITINIFAWRNNGRYHRGYYHNNECYMSQKDSAEIK